MGRFERTNTNKATGNKRAKGYDMVQIVQTGHIAYVDVKGVGTESANVIIGVRSSVGNRYDKNHDDHNEVTIWWSRFFKDGDAANKFADQCIEGKYVIVFGKRTDLNKKNKEGKFIKEAEYYNIDTIQWGVDFSNN